jgi:hypothetical protein
MNLPPYAHTCEGSNPEAWEPLFTPFAADPTLQRQRLTCLQYQKPDPNHGHLNKLSTRQNQGVWASRPHA